MRTAAALVTVLALCGCASTPEPIAVAQVEPPSPEKPYPVSAPPKPAVVAQLKAAAAKKLKDPYSAQWERMMQGVRPNGRGEPTKVVCGYVNSKNGFGAYTGAKAFVYLVDTQDFWLPEGDMAIVMREAVGRLCVNLI